MKHSPAVRVHKLSNGITVLGEEIESASSAAFSILLPVGAAVDPEGQEGTATILAEMLNKGAGSWNARELSEQFEIIGTHRHHASGTEVSVFSGSLLAENLLRALELYAVVLQSPRLPAEEIDSVRQLALQELDSLEDDPSGKVMVELSAKFYPYPFGRCQLGTQQGLSAVTAESLRSFYEQSYRPERAVIAVTGSFDWPAVAACIERCYGSWTGAGPNVEARPLSLNDSSFHLERDTSQLQIALAYPSVSFVDPDYYAAKTAVAVLSGGMSGRLFVEVREKLGLVYRVSASHSATKGRAAVFCYAGTTLENAERTLEVMLRELRGLAAGVPDDELRRSKADLKSRLIMQSEISSVRASALVNDWWNMGRVRSIGEIRDAIDRVTSDDICAHLERCPVSPITLVTLGRKKLELKH